MLIRALLARLILPGIVAFAVPLLWLRLDEPSGPFGFVGALPLGTGSVLLLWCARDFLVTGQGTLAPWNPPRRLVEVGAYRFSRNPMYVAVTLILLGWALAYRSLPIFLYALLLIPAFHLRVVWVEEPRLQRAFGDKWRRYAARVPRWFWRVRAEEKEEDDALDRDP